ncbi:MAG: ATP phosphoribosyltransferase regulatory subunit [Methylophilaceae bacterium]|jgi:ATP phosphoribosyltransferase regulatory subunit
MRNWLLPEFIEDVMPAEAGRIESLRRQLLDMFKVHGYQYVIPPTLEYVESLITGTGSKLDIATFKVVDQLTGRMMGIRADTTPQAARIDAHMLNHQGVSRLCYAGKVLRTAPSGLARTREPLQVGAELFGHTGVESDIEIQCLMIKSLQAIGLTDLHIDFSHVGLFESLIEAGSIDEDLENALYGALLSKDKTLVAELANGLDKTIKQALIDLTDLNGDVSVLKCAQTTLPALPNIQKALQDLTRVAEKLVSLDIQIGFDLSELRGYHYHSGLVFAAYAQSYSGPLALGGRYDEVGESFGRARPATGFSLDLRGVVTALSAPALAKGILAPVSDDVALQVKIDTLRAEGQIVIQALPNDETNLEELNCDQTLKQTNGEWQVMSLTN